MTKEALREGTNSRSEGEFGTWKRGNQVSCRSRVHHVTWQRKITQIIQTLKVIKETIFANYVFDYPRHNSFECIIYWRLVHLRIPNFDREHRKGHWR